MASPSRGGVAGTSLAPLAYTLTYGSAGAGSLTGQGSGWFGPSVPMRPTAPAEVAGRRFDYPTGYNLNTTARAFEPVSFAQLRRLADGYDLLRLVIETRKDQAARMIERVEATGRQMDALGGKLDRMDEKLEGVAYRRDIEHFVVRDEIERRIDKAVDGAKAEAAKGLAEVAGQVRDLRKIGWGLASAALLAFGGIVLAKIGLAGR
ncbi:hypothetical protein ACQKQD_26935 [Methylobacterium sp. NPDC080182]|uniref:hypothetical protein n=1 Tax=Methylobacterium sp. NPDC080182 TaxID=3390590 RepID=UPI003D029F59